ncbi:MULTISPECIES: helix-turn-helix domain-containing protein [unclassified Streptomyces]|uniref:helix-turn-helix domain-containing protein n=1 Tax=unclassified Streptomyces TaxID=2593676 RepID=UPI001660C18C|nr:MULTISPECIES: helix-turn-helix transcriptional regulator [unclassified Streptomyces]MBD0710775.1 transcriptional regulator [Streptomyces sp. CBMA291]MBD0718128.1 transcriptional regulator [Streptomyces sp. CBMA370]
MADKRPRPPTVRLRRLAAELRKLRAEAGLTREDVSERTGINEATLYRIERSRARPQKRTLVGLLDVYRASETQRADLLALQSGSNDQERVRTYHSELSEKFASYLGFESEARTVRTYESLFVPGLAQTEPYTLAVVRGTLPAVGRKETEQRLQVRRERQTALAGAQPPRFRAVVDEAALRREVGGPEVMRDQLWHLLDLMAEPHITLQVLPFTCGAHVGMTGGFTHMDFPDADDPELVYVETPAGDAFLEAEEEIRHFKSMFENLQAVALGPDDSAELLRLLAKELEGKV